MPHQAGFIFINRRSRWFWSRNHLFNLYKLISLLGLRTRIHFASCRPNAGSSSTISLFNGNRTLNELRFISVFNADAYFSSTLVFYNSICLTVESFLRNSSHMRHIPRKSTSRKRGRLSAPRSGTHSFAALTLDRPRFRWFRSFYSCAVYIADNFPLTDFLSGMVME